MMTKTPKPPEPLTFPTAEAKDVKPAPKKPKFPPPPGFLSAARKAFWRRTVQEWDLGDDEIELLRLACQMLDRADAARREISREGVTRRDRFDQVVEHPAARIERASCLAAARLLKQLGLTDEVPAPPGRPPTGGGGRLDVK